MNLNIVSNVVPNDSVSLKKVIEEKRLLKTKVKLLQIKLLDQDLESLETRHLSLAPFDLEHLFLTPKYHLICESLIIEETSDLKLRSYLIYLSYLYSFDFLRLYEEDENELWQVIEGLNISQNIKDSLYSLLMNQESSYFSEFAEELNNPEFREMQRLDKLILHRKCQRD